MKKILNIGYGNTVIVSTIQAIVSYDSSPSKRLVNTARDFNKLVDGTMGSKTASVIVTSGDYVVLSALSVDALRKRLEEE